MVSSTRLAALLQEGERDPKAALARRAEGDALAASADEDLAFRWRLLVLRAMLAAPPPDDTVAELYGELVDRSRDDDERLATVRALGEQIRALQAQDRLPRTMLARAPRPPRRSPP